MALNGEEYISESPGPFITAPQDAAVRKIHGKAVAKLRYSIWLIAWSWQFSSDPFQGLPHQRLCCQAIEPGMLLCIQ
jgi:hypothetical protein